MSMLLLPAALLLATAPGEAAAEAAPVKGFEPFAAVGAAGGDEAPAVHCSTNGRWCGQVDPHRAILALVERSGDGPGAMRVWTVPLPGADEESARYEIWPHLRIEADGALLAGALRRRSTGFSGGGASSAMLVLVRLPADRSALSEAGELPYAGGADIRACFDEANRRARLGACSDEYEFAASIAAEPADGAPAALRLETRARTFPGRRSRTEDSLAGPPLRRRDLVWAEDPDCSYRRVFTFDAATGLYAPDAPLPDCANYFGF